VLLLLSVHDKNHPLSSLHAPKDLRSDLKPRKSLELWIAATTGIPRSLWITHIIRPSSLHGPLSYRSSSRGFLLWFLEFPCRESAVLFPFRMISCHRTSRGDHCFHLALLLCPSLSLIVLPHEASLHGSSSSFVVPGGPFSSRISPASNRARVLEMLLTTILRARRRAITRIFMTSKSRKTCTSTHLQPLGDS
jgi:hypothetical protein